MATRRLIVLLITSLVVVALLALPAIATEGDGESEAGPGETTESTVAEPVGDLEPAVTVEQEAPEESSLDWTYRYMIPTGIVLGVLVIVVTAGQYFTSVVRKRYRIVEE